MREAHEEAGLLADRVTVRGTVVTAAASGTAWTYTTVVADADGLLDTVPNRESAELRWVDPAALVAEIAEQPHVFAPWLAGVLALLPDGR